MQILTSTDDNLTFMDNKTRNAVIAAMKRSWRLYSIERQLALKRSEVLGVGPRGGKRFECGHCRGLFGSNLIDVDHIDPFIPLDKNSSEIPLKMLYKRLFCDADNLSVLCKSCHDKKSGDENKVRTHHRQEKRKREKLNKQKVA